MEALGINFGYLLAQCVLPGLWLLFSLLALFRLRGQKLPETAKALWAIFIVVVPFLGALTYVIVQPGSPEKP